MLPLILLASTLLAANESTPVVSIARTTQAPALEDFARMRPGAESRFARVEGFVQRLPSDGKPATQETNVYLSYDDDNLYVVFVCFDDRPADVRARKLARGPQVLDDDYVSIQIDSYRDQRRAYAFAANPLGIQNTGTWIEGQGWDFTFDTVWHSEGVLTNEGYVVTMTIPFRSLRFPPTPRQTWGLILQRNIPRNNEESYWPANSSRIKGRLNQAGLLTGIEHISPGRNVQLIPYGAFRSFRALELDETGGPHFVSDPFESRFGLDVKAVVKDSFVFDATVNPEFSQVESDEPQVTVNQRFEVFFPERRPFFLENAGYFQTPINLLFTRRIRDPSVGARLTGKAGSYAVGALLTDDRATASIRKAARAFFGVFRVSRDVGDQGSVGFMFTDKESGPSHNHVLAVDGRIKVSPNWTTSFQAATSSTFFGDGRSLAGPAYELSLSRAGRQLTYDLEYSDRSPGFHTEVGFDPRPDIRAIKQLVNYRFRPEGERLVSWGPDFLVQHVTDHDGTLLDFVTGPAFHWEWMRQTSFGVYYLHSREHLRPRDFPGLQTTKGFSTSRWGLLFSTGFFPQVSVRGGYANGSGINLVPAAGATPSASRLSSAELALTVRPMTALTIDNTYLMTRLEDVFENHILRSLWNYQITRELSVRAILQFDSVRANPERSSLPSSKNFNADFLVKYFLHHGTALYVGYNSNLRDFGPSVLASLSELRQRDSAFFNDSRQFFVKISYLARF